MIAFSAGNFNQPLKYRVPAGYNADSFLSTFCLKPCHRIELPILKEGERLLLSDNHRRKVGTNRLIKISLESDFCYLLGTFGN